MRSLNPPTPCRVSRLANGLRVATVEMPQMTSASVGLWAGMGSRYEPAPLNGVSHFIEHMLFKGTRRRSALEISQAVEGIGGYLNAFTSEETTCFHAKARHDRWPELLEVLTDMYLYSRFDPADIRKEREVIKEEVALYYDEPQQHVLELLNATQWPDQPLGRPITGTVATLDRLGRKELTGWMAEHYLAANTLICAAGRLTHGAVLRAARQYAHRFSSGARPRFAPATPRPGGPVIRLHRRAIEQTQLAVGIRTCSRHDGRRYALRLLNVILGENTSSRLFQSVREDSGLAYSIHSSVSFFDDTGDLVIAAGLDEDKLAPVLRVIRRELETLAAQAPSAGELRRARDYVVGQIDLSLENTESQMMNLGEQLLGFGDFLPPEAVKRQLARVTPAHIRQVADEFFRRDRLSVALVSPIRTTRHLETILA